MEPIIGAPASGGDVVKDGSVKTFQADVIDASRNVPVIVDFWAPWCGPCKQLGPIIEKAVRAANGKARLVKINIDENQQIARSLRIQSIPAVYAFVQGQPVDGFVGALSESQVKAFLTRLIGDTGPSPVDQALEHAKAAFDKRDFGTAAAVYQQVLRHDAANAQATAGLARAYLGLNQAAKAREVLAKVSPELAKHPEVVGAKSQLALLEQADGKADLAELKARLEANAGDHQDLAMAHFARGERAAAVDELIEIIRRDREWNNQGARSQLLKMFEAFGNSDPVTVAGRRKLSSVWFS
jgi:putative thioredoxin